MTETRKPAKQAKTDAREARLAAALRENLRRRKAQGRAREAGESEASRKPGTDERG